MDINHQWIKTLPSGEFKTVDFNNREWKPAMLKLIKDGERIAYNPNRMPYDKDIELALGREGYVDFILEADHNRRFLSKSILN
jgi:hypothetical protein